MRRRLVLLICAACALPACERFGYSNRVLLRVTSPDGRLVAVCQEIPELDGPSYDIRVERPDGTRIRQLLRGGDGDPCSELAWSPDGRLLAVLSTHVARVRVADVARILEQPPSPSSRWATRQFDLSSENDLRLGRRMQFVGPLEIEVTTCPYDLRETQRTHTMRCTSGERPVRFAVPVPLAAGG
jgi:hypothetical protein